MLHGREDLQALEIEIGNVRRADLRTAAHLIARHPCASRPTGQADLNTVEKQPRSARDDVPI